MLRLVLGFAAAVIVGSAATGLGLTLVVSPSIAIQAPRVASVPQFPAAPSPQQTQLHHLPQWVQTRQAAALWSGPDKEAVQFTSLPAWTFLRVDGAQQDRLEVEYAGDGNSRKPGPGWVGLADVQPSDQSGSWLRTYRASSLFDGAASSTVIATAPQWSWMLRLDDASGDRLHVRLYSPSLTSVAGEGWLPAADVGPTGPPAQSVFSGADLKPPPSEYTSHADFITAVASAAGASEVRTAPVSVTVAQAILESNWGQSTLSREANNYFGIKAMGSIGDDGAVWMRTLEYVQGGSYNVFAAFRAYKSLADSVADHARLFRDNPRYAPALQSLDDPDEFARRIAAAGYATDPDYAQKLIDIMRQNNLYALDAPAPRVDASTA